MSFFPEIEEIVYGTESKEIGIDFLFDAKTGQHIVEKGNLRECSERETLEQWIKKTITTQLGAYEVYVRDENENYGVRVYDKLGTKDRGYWLSELKREITEQLLKNENITAIEKYDVAYVKRRVIISFTVITTDGIDIDIEVDKYA